MNSSGNVLFLILIAVALFAALSYAVTQASRSGSSNITQEKAELCVSEINSYFTGLQGAITRALMSGISDHQLDFFNNTYRTGSGTLITAANGSCTSSECRLFTTHGGSITPSVISPSCLSLNDTYWNGAPGPGQVEFRTFKIQDVGSPNQDSLVGRIWRVDEEVCKAYNTSQGLPTEPGNIYFRYVLGADYSGTLTSFPAYDGVDFTHFLSSGNSLAGKMSFCASADTVTRTFIIYNVLHTR